MMPKKCNVSYKNRCSDRAVKLWSPEVVVKQYLEVYEKAIALNQQ